MNHPLDNHQPGLIGMDRLIDRLVDGELTDRDRRALLVRLETEPEGWRRCALAFLEAQNWREAFAPLAAPTPFIDRPAVVPVGKDRKPSRWRSVARLTALAASLALTFALGWTLHGTQATTASGDPVTRVEQSVPTPHAETPRPESNHLVTSDATPPQSNVRLAALAPVVKQWEQRGYQAETETRLVSLKLKDGRTVDVPVHEVRLRYVGDRTY
jgi:anti-sigma factor RsiW